MAALMTTSTDETRPLYKYDDDNDTLSDEEEDKESDIGRLKNSEHRSVSHGRCG